MNIVVCVKQVIDPEAPPSSFKIDPAVNKAVSPAGVAPVISTFDEYAVEAAVLLKEKVGGTVTALSLGSGMHRDVVKKPLAMGADDLVLLEDPAFADGDAWSTAYALALAIKKIGHVDLVLCGRQAADWDSGQIGLGIAEILGLPCVHITKKIEAEDGKLKVERVIPDGSELVEVPLPALITLSNEHAAPRYPNIKGIMAAKRKEPIVWKPGDIGADPAKTGSAGSKVKLLKLFKPTREAKCEVVTGDTPEEAGARLADRLKETNLI